MSVVHNVDTTTCGTSVAVNVDQLSVADSTTGHSLRGSRRCRRCSHSKRNSHTNSDADSNHNTCSFLCIHVPRRSDDMCCIKHYSDQNLDSVRRHSISLENMTSPEATPRAGRESPSDTSGGGGRAGTVGLVDSSGGAVCGESHAPSQEGGDGCQGGGMAGNPGSGDNCGGDDDDEDSSNSATSMLRNKRKPRSRLKKFLTSLLSLSSSSSDEEH